MLRGKVVLKCNRTRVELGYDRQLEIDGRVERRHRVVQEMVPVQVVDSQKELDADEVVVEFNDINQRALHAVELGIRSSFGPTVEDDLRICEVVQPSIVAVGEERPEARHHLGQ